MLCDRVTYTLLKTILFFFPFLQEKYLLPSPDVSPEKPFPLLNESPPVKTEEEWPSGSSELLIGLTDDNRKLVGYMVPWDPWIYQQLFNPAVGGTEVKNKKNSLIINITISLDVIGA